MSPAGSRRCTFPAAENVYPAEVENVLCLHPAVQEAAVAGVPDEKWGEVGCAHIILRQGQSADAKALSDWCRERLAGYKVPRHFRFTDDLPRTAAGKVQKQSPARARGAVMSRSATLDKTFTQADFDAFAALSGGR